MSVTDEVIARYREIYGLGETVGRPQVEAHWRLETALTKELLDSTPQDRWDTFSRCYTQLYTELPWLNQGENPEAARRRWAPWMHLVRPNSKVFEIGSGGAVLLKQLAAQGHDCVATEITKERGSMHVSGSDKITWRTTDGINLANFEPSDFYDVVVSSQVVEHFHPDDLTTHFRNARMILKPGGRYIFDTPHRGTGPHDLSRVFGLERAVCMHLREYDYPEIGRAIEAAGFRNVRAIFNRAILGKPHESRFGFWIYCMADRLFGWMRLRPLLERRIRLAMRGLIAPTKIWISAEK
ncbi:MAG TPA: class I SAM-dependent methyltransferase [Caulobacteraceae bacterium]|jgi:SAM-dependent methyltransferase